MSKTYFVTGIDTEIGKTIVSSILVEKLKADYWKPVQSGDLHHTDTMKVQGYISNSKSVFHPEGFRLTEPMSPHASAAIDGVEIKLTDFTIPKTDNHLIIEGAGGLMVPLNDQDMIIDLMQKLAIPVILVSKNYLGSINHTILSIEMLRMKGIELVGVIFNGEPNPETERVIQAQTGVKVLGNIPKLAEINKATVAAQVDLISFK